MSLHLIDSSVLRDIVARCIEIVSSNRKLLANHTANFLSENLFNQLLTPQVRHVLQSLPSKDVMTLPIDIFAPRQDSLVAEIGFGANLHTRHVSSKTGKMAVCSKMKKIRHEQFQMSPKKLHEVEQMCSFIGLNVGSTLSVADLGSGKGYLSDALKQGCGLDVTGIECCSAFNEGAAKRVLKTSRLWNKVDGISQPRMQESKSISSNNELFSEFRLEEDGVTESVKSKRKRDESLELKLREKFNDSLLSQSYRMETKWVTSGLDLSGIMGNEDHVLVGLHTCGDLAATSIKLFLSCDHCKFLCNVGCCYNILTEQVSDCGFPLSSFVKDICPEELGPVKSLACLSPDKVAQGMCRDPLEKIFNRALLQKFVLERCGVLLDHSQQYAKNKVGKSFLVYFKSVVPKLGIEGLENVLDSEIESYAEFHSDQKQLLLLFNQYRACFTPLLENIFLIDRLLFLRENGIDNSAIVQIFDPVISPRCYAIVASKDNPKPIVISE